MNYNLISKYKTQLMGIAMILVICFHSTIFFNTKILNFIKFRLDIGVDLFFLLSGIGIYYSLQKNNNIKEFYKKRFSKIIFTYIPVSIICSFLFLILGYFSEIDFFANITFSNFILAIGNFPIWYWYIPSTLIMYFISPLILKFYKRINNSIKANIIIGFIIFLLILITLTPTLNNLLIFTTRIPIYIIGLNFGILSYNKKKIKGKSILIIFILSVINLYFLYYIFNHQIPWYLKFLNNILYIFPTLTISIALSYIFDYLNLKFKNFQFPILSFVGKITLEIYSFHERIIILLLLLLNKYFPDLNIGKYTFNLVALIITITIAYLWNKILEWIKRN